MQPDVCVVHLIWVPYGIQLFKDFISSYQAFDAGYSHQLILLFNGVSDESQTVAYHAYIKQTAIVYQSFYYPQGQDLEAYKFVAEKLTCDYVLFVNSYSRFQAKNWLCSYVNALHDMKVGLIGATGSWQSYYSSIFVKYSWSYSRSTSLTDNFTKYKLLLKALFLWRFYFKPFPNPHVRTNGFFINRKIFLRIKYKSPATKLDAYRIESGRNSITQQLLNSGYKTVLIDKHGNVYNPDQWIRSKIFWNDEQENLLIADNQTGLYKNASIYEKVFLQKIAWGIIT